MYFWDLDTFDNVLIPPARPSSEDAFTSFVISEIDVTGKIDPNKLPGKWKEAGFTCKLIEADSEDLNEFSWVLEAHVFLRLETLAAITLPRYSILVHSVSLHSLDLTRWAWRGQSHPRISLENWVCKIWKANAKTSLGVNSQAVNATEKGFVQILETYVRRSWNRTARNFPVGALVPRLLAWMPRSSSTPTMDTGLIRSLKTHGSIHRIM